jgi:phosphate-selective porin OprO/OprP
MRQMGVVFCAFLAALFVAGRGTRAQDVAEISDRLDRMQADIDALAARTVDNQENSYANEAWNRGVWGGTLIPGLRRTTDVPFIEDVGQTPTFPNVRITGLLQADAGYFSQDSANVTTVGSLQDVFGFRRARLAAFGDVSEFVSYIIEMDFAGPSRPSFKDVWAELHAIPVLGNVRIGYWRMPFGMDELTSVRELMFLERPLDFALAPFRQVGVGFADTNAAQTMTWEAAGFRFPTDFFGGFQGNRGYGFAGRLTALPVYADGGRRGVHLGVDYSFINPGSGAAQFGSPPEFAGPFVGTAGNLASVPNFIDTGPVSASHYHLFNAEAGGVLGSWYAQSELRYAIVSESSGRTSTLPAFYVQSGYFLTGEVRPYNKVAGVFGRVRPLHCFGEDGGLGAFEVALRYSYMDLNGMDFNGGRLNDLTVGLNWYLNQFAKLQLNYIRAFLNDPIHGASEASVYALRAQVDF